MHWGNPNWKHSHKIYLYFHDHAISYGVFLAITSTKFTGYKLGKRGLNYTALWRSDTTKLCDCNLFVAVEISSLLNDTSATKGIIVWALLYYCGATVDMWCTMVGHDDYYTGSDATSNEITKTANSDMPLLWAGIVHFSNGILYTFGKLDITKLWLHEFCCFPLLII